MRPVLTLLFVALLLSCSKNNSYTGKIFESEKMKFGVDTITDKLANPWGIAFLPDGRILITERAGAIRIVKDGVLLDETLSGVPPVYAQGQGGLLDIQLHPDYATNGWIYLSYAKPGADGTSATTLARARLSENALTDFTQLFAAQPFVNSGVHFGSRIAFDGNGYVFVTCGERGTMSNAQTLENHLGKVIRLHDDGRVPADNPFVNTPGAKPEIWSYGHRNLQGLVYDRETNTLWNHEHGPKGGDELNLLEKGKNYGWPVITYGINYDGNPISDKTELEGMEQPVWYWVPSIAPCGMVRVSSDKFPAWKNNFLVGALALQHIARVEVADNKYRQHEKLLEGVARFRAEAQSPDGYIYAATESPGMLLKIVPIAE